MSEKQLLLSSEELLILVKDLTLAKEKGGYCSTVFKHVSRKLGGRLTPQELEEHYLQVVYPGFEKGTIKVEGFTTLPMFRSLESKVIKEPKQSQDNPSAEAPWDPKERQDMFEWVSSMIALNRQKGMDEEQAKAAALRGWPAQAERLEYPVRGLRSISGAYHHVLRTRPQETVTSVKVDGTNDVVRVGQTHNNVSSSSALAIPSTAAPGAAVVKRAGGFLGPKNLSLVYARMDRGYNNDEAARFISNLKVEASDSISAEYAQFLNNLKVSDTLLGRLENNKEIPTNGVATKISLFYNVPKDQLFPMIRADHRPTALTVKSRLAELRSLSGLTQKGLCLAVQRETGVHVSISTISRIENDQRLHRAQVPQATAIANYFGVGVADITSRVDTEYVAEIRKDTAKTNKVMSMFGMYSLEEIVRGIVQEQLNELKAPKSRRLGPSQSTERVLA